MSELRLFWALFVTAYLISYFTTAKISFTSRIENVTHCVEVAIIY